jgi:hypothetical protein
MVVVKQEKLDLFPDEIFTIKKNIGGIESFLKYLEDVYRKSIEKVHCGPVDRLR